jgi:hypothetical protein
MDRLCMTEVLAMVMPQGQEDVSLSLGADGGAICGGVSASSEAGEQAKGGFLGGGNARQVHNTAQDPFQKVMSRRGMCSKGRAPHRVVGIGMVEGGTAVALDGRGVGGQNSIAEAVAELSRALHGLVPPAR